MTKLEEETRGDYRASAARGNVREVIEMCPKDVCPVPPTVHRLFSAVSFDWLPQALGKHFNAWNWLGSAPLLTPQSP